MVSRYVFKRIAADPAFDSLASLVGIVIPEFIDDEAGQPSRHVGLRHTNFIERQPADYGVAKKLLVLLASGPIGIMR